MMKLLDVAEAVSRAAACACCGEPSHQEFETAIREELARNPRLLDDPDSSIVLVCGSCSAKGLCRCGRNHRTGV